MNTPLSTPVGDPPPALDLDGLDYEVKIQLAVKAIRESPLRENGTPELSVRAAAGLYGVKRGTLANRLTGMKTCRAAHADERLLSDAEEEVLSEWVQSLGKRGLPVGMDLLRDYAADISGTNVGVNWPRKFMERHPELKIKKTTTLEECRARSLNPTVVAEFFEMLKGLMEDYDIPAENIYNADEKEIQLGVGKGVAAIVDRTQTNVQQVENGNREMVTIIEAVCADGTALPPSVIFQGKRRILEWGENNPCNASLSISPNGWTDQELGALWLEKDFDPASHARNKTGGYRLLIIDGHNSHTTYKFCHYAEKHRIIVVRLPSHTTHALQPCDVAVFSPLSNSWKTVVNHMTHNGIPITKRNFLELYHEARTKAFKSSTIISAFSKTGIWPLNPHAIPIEAFEPAKNTSSQASMPVPVALAPLLESIVTSFHTSTATDIPMSTTTEISNSTPPSLPSSTATSSTLRSDSSTESVRYRISGIPPELPHWSSRADLRTQNVQLRDIIKAAEEQLARDHALNTALKYFQNLTQFVIKTPAQWKVMMEQENERLRQKLYHKTAEQKKTYSSTNPRHMTSGESLDQLAEAEWKGAWKVILKQAGPTLKERKKSIEQAEKKAEAEENKRKAAEKKRLRYEKTQRKADEKKQQQAAKKAGRDLARLVKESARGRGIRGGRGRGKGVESAARESEEESEISVPTSRSESSAPDTTEGDDNSQSGSSDAPQLPRTRHQPAPPPLSLPIIPAPAPPLIDTTEPDVHRNPGCSARNINK